MVACCFQNAHRGISVSQPVVDLAFILCICPIQADLLFNLPANEQVCTRADHGIILRETNADKFSKSGKSPKFPIIQTLDPYGQLHKRLVWGLGKDNEFAHFILLHASLLTLGPVQCDAMLRPLQDGNLSASSCAMALVDIPFPSVHTTHFISCLGRN